MLFTERRLVERFETAARAVEFWCPPVRTLTPVADAKLDDALMNFDGVDLAAGDRGMIGLPPQRRRDGH